MCNQHTTKKTTPTSQPCLSILPISQREFILPDIQKITFFHGDVVQVNRNDPQIQREPPNRTDSKITKLSAKSRRRLWFVTATCGIAWKGFMTLTYPAVYPKSGKDVKRDLNAHLQWMRRRELTTYLWFMEFQTRGAPHVHILTTNRPKFEDRRDFAARWSSYLADAYNLGDQAIAKVNSVHLHQRQWQTIRNSDGAARYVAKYAYKTRQKIVPEGFQDVGRFWGNSRDVVPREKMTVDVTETEVRLLLRTMGHPAADYKIVPKYLFNLHHLDDSEP